MSVYGTAQLCGLLTLRATVDYSLTTTNHDQSTPVYNLGTWGCLFFFPSYITARNLTAAWCNFSHAVRVDSPGTVKLESLSTSECIGDNCTTEVTATTTMCATQVDTTSKQTWMVQHVLCGAQHVLCSSTMVWNGRVDKFFYKFPDLGATWLLWQVLKQSPCSCEAAWMVSSTVFNQESVD